MTARSKEGDRALGGLLLLGGTLGLVAAFILTIEKIALLKDVGYAPSCNLNPILSCGSVMESAQAELFGFPNPLIGLIAFPIVAATGAGLLAGAHFATWYWRGLQVGVSLAAMLVGWLIFQSLYRIGALCPYCMAVWAVVIPIFWYVSLRNATSGVLGARIARTTAVQTLSEWRMPLVVATMLIVIVLITEQFWYYWQTIV
ncbi:vitamin K epoxide reductase [Nocardioides sp. Root190]|uniref:vitamin K epoxide reductase family protein n=1 Tax=Nocardioides sp. Root190 TaxID=1736488 RepID=UPI0006FF0216|nr:vitamin K epoxide reductase family protein [Nocardioides sp. Root190]KRB73119.1 vitamin K epoxide reductase [Nocardioides sp. Root190]